MDPAALSSWLSLLHDNPTLTLTLAGLFGLLVGSFLNVVILRWPERLKWQWDQMAREHLGLEEHTEESTRDAPDDLIVTGSRCPSCKHRLAWWENLPLLSFLILRGKCRACKNAISFQYPLVEAMGAGVAMAAVACWGPSFHALAVMAAGWTLLVLSGIDARTMLLPDPLVYVLLWAGLLQAAAGAGGSPSPSASIEGAAAGYLSLWTVYWAFKLIRKKEGMGYGDFKLLGALGAWTGPLGLLGIVLGASLTGAAVGLARVARGHDRASPFPFGPFLAAGGFFTLLFPNWLNEALRWLR